MDPDIAVAAELLVETGVTLNSFRLTSSILSSKEYVKGIAKKNHGSRDISSRAAQRRLVVSPVTEALEAADATDTAISPDTAGEECEDVRDCAEI